MTTLNDFITPTLLNLGNRADLNLGSPPTRVQQWIIYAYTDLCMTVPFEELQFTVDDIFQPTIGEYDYPVSARAIVTLSLNPSIQGNINTSQRHLARPVGSEIPLADL